ncbi:hypothetical protein OIU34_21845 [Pararhizobium sp. BT-229]|uniref:ABC-three component system middle component 6 n=1 Tax=Pararhizobium sp. BT-229 TaxID=2986923 RepID=UPI0021F7C05E|nr:ABC-three component system middle component 6 [Pararhizobium sp. BT-229]MCV9964537.1 hypothetical protein [Pararhizobium sp. BT-229]
MILLPTKYLPPERTVIFIGGEVLALLASGPLLPGVISDRINDGRRIPVNFDTVALVLAFLYAIGAVEADGETIRLTAQSKKGLIDAH